MNLQARLVLFKIKKCVYLLGFMVHTWRSHSVVIIFNQFICIGFKVFFPTTKSPQSQQTGSKNRFVNWMARCITGWPWILEDLSTGLNVRQIGPTFPVFWHHLVAVMWLSSYVGRIESIIDWDFQCSGGDDRNLLVSWCRRRLGKRNYKSIWHL